MVGQSLRQDLQSSLSFNSATVFDVSNTTTTVITNTGYWRVVGFANTKYSNFTREEEASIIVNDGATDKVLWAMEHKSDSVYVGMSTNVDYIVFLPAGHSLKIKSSSVDTRFNGSIRQIADIDGNLTNP